MGINKRVRTQTEGSATLGHLSVRQGELIDWPISEPCRVRAVGLFLRFFRGHGELSQRTGLAFPFPHPRRALPKIVYCSDSAEVEGHPPRRKADKEVLPRLRPVSPTSPEREPCNRFQPGRYSSEAALCVSQYHLGTGFSLLLVFESCGLGPGCKHHDTLYLVSQLKFQSMFILNIPNPL